MATNQQLTDAINRLTIAANALVAALDAARNSAVSDASVEAINNVSAIMEQAVNPPA